jgi:hypothetical protein
MNEFSTDAKRPPGNRAAFSYGRQFQRRQSHQNSLIQRVLAVPGGVKKFLREIATH